MKLPPFTSPFLAHLATYIYPNIMSDQPKLIIRDGINSDIPRCCELDSNFRTEHVWQMTVRSDSDEITITLRKQRLPRPMDSEHEIDPKRLDHVLNQKQCFIVLEESTQNTLLGFISMRIDAAYQLAYIHDIVIDMPYRRQSLGTRLIHVARLWAEEQDVKQLILEVPTINYPAIEFAKSQGFVYCGFNDQYLPNQEIALFYGLSL